MDIRLFEKLPLIGILRGIDEADVEPVFGAVGALVHDHVEAVRQAVGAMKNTE